MQTVIEALHVAEGASIKMRINSGCKLVWRPRTKASMSGMPIAHRYGKYQPVLSTVH